MTAESARPWGAGKIAGPYLFAVEPVKSGRGAHVPKRTARRSFPYACRGDNRHGRGGLATGSAAAVLVAIAALLAALLYAGCYTSTPEGTVREFIRARMAGDENRAAGLTVEGDLTEYLGGEGFLAGSGVSFDAWTAELSGDRARVVVHFRGEEGEADVSYICRRVGSRWKVSLRETEEFRLPDLKLLGEEENT